MFLIILTIQLLIAYFLNNLGISADFNAYFFIITNMLYMVYQFLKNYYEISGYLLFAYFTRIIFMLWDLYARHIFVFPGSGNDTEGFYRSAVLISNNSELLRNKIYGGVYSKFLGSLFYIIGDNRILGQYVNVLFGTFIVILIYKSMKLLDISKGNQKIAIILASFFPNSLIFSSILLREIMMTFFVTVSIYFFIKWYKQGGYKNQIYSIFSLLFATTFHSGIIVIIIGYAFMYILYNREKSKFKISFNSVILLLIFTIVVVLIMNNQDLFLDKVTRVDDLDGLVGTVNSRRGGSQYLASLKLNSWWQILLYSPIYMIYFLISPLPWDWRGMADVVTFFIDSLIYLSFLFILFKKFKKEMEVRENQNLIYGLLLGLVFTIFIFGIGVANAGTAMRHRHKLFPVMVILTSMITDQISD